MLKRMYRESRAGLMSGILRSQGLWPHSELQPGVDKSREVVPSGQLCNSRDLWPGLSMSAG